MVHPAAGSHDVGGIHGQTTTTTTVTETHVRTNLRFDPSYVKTPPGSLKVVAVILDICVFICGVCTGAAWRSSTFVEWSFFVSMTAFWITNILIVFYLLHIIEKFHVVPWNLIEMVFCAIWSLFFCSVAIDCAVKASQTDISALAALSFFASAAVIVYGVDAYLKGLAWKAGQLAQGERVVQVTRSSQRDVL